jgi:hypothetical protein
LFDTTQKARIVLVTVVVSGLRQRNFPHSGLANCAGHGSASDFVASGVSSAPIDAAAEAFYA